MQITQRSPLFSPNNAWQAADSTNDNALQHVVQFGESLHNIAQRYGVSTASILARNPSINNPDLIYPGQLISLPQAEDANSPLYRNAFKPFEPPAKTQAPEDSVKGQGKAALQFGDFKVELDLGERKLSAEKNSGAFKVEASYSLENGLDGKAGAETPVVFGGKVGADTDGDVSGGLFIAQMKVDKDGNITLEVGPSTKNVPVVGKLLEKLGVEASITGGTTVNIEKLLLQSPGVRAAVDNKTLLEAYNAYLIEQGWVLAQKDLDSALKFAEKRFGAFEKYVFTLASSTETNVETAEWEYAGNHGLRSRLDDQQQYIPGSRYYPLHSEMDRVYNNGIIRDAKATHQSAKDLVSDISRAISDFRKTHPEPTDSAQKLTWLNELTDHLQTAFADRIQGIENDLYDFVLRHWRLSPELRDILGV